MLNEIRKIRYYAVAVLVALGMFAWAGFTGTRLLGDDDERVETKQGYYGRSGSSGGYRRTGFYHK
ncbi:hypothetical protein DYU11_21390 [Fibrisoma montanum]|uniref:Uncharacterized protein n=1 Tax=Fibrisoma montanum TaxID=2305895 RepID=A0A418M4E1_9BACT|nr:hypothetical protein [Fibrisoma montanum]RIV20600.1 hypothetical protein DYU11_21390 [Fibrisoma montanum]